MSSIKVTENGPRQLHWAKNTLAMIEKTRSHHLEGNGADSIHRRRVEFAKSGTRGNTDGQSV